MNAPRLVQSRIVRAAPPVPTFTLGRALSWLGHDCRGQCSTGIGGLRVELWFIHRTGNLPMMPRGAVVVVDLGQCDEPLPPIRRLIGQVNRCAGVDGIQLRERNVSDTGPAVATVVAASSLESRLRGLLAVDPARPGTERRPVAASRVGERS